MSLLELLAGAAADLGVGESRTSSGATEWLAAGRPFATAASEHAEFRLAPAIARAALGTPDTEPSTRGVGWIRFAPPELDRFARDRAVAWFGSAYRHAAD